MDEFLNHVLEQIRCRKARAFIKEELQGHIEEQTTDNIKSGMDQDSAKKAAIKDMGDPIETGIALDRIHRPQIEWRMVAIIAIISILGIVLHMLISSKTDSNMGANGSGMQYLRYVMIGIAAMFFMYWLDYTIIARFSRMIAVLLIVLCIATLFGGITINGRNMYLYVAEVSINIPAVMLFYIPVYGGIVYKYRGMGYKGVLVSIIWMVVPVFLVLRLPSIMTAFTMLLTMMGMLTIAIYLKWFSVATKKTIGTLWGIVFGLPFISLVVMYFGNILAEYQQERIQAFLTQSDDGNYLVGILRDIYAKGKILGNTGEGVTTSLPSFNSDYIFTYIISSYGLIVGVVVICLLTVLVIAMIGASIRQKNQLGMIIGCGCSMVFAVNIVINILENIGALPLTATFLPFLSAGGSNIIISYALTGIILSVYRYKNIYPNHVDTRLPKHKITIGL